MTEQTRTAILAAVRALYAHGMIHDDGMGECLGCPFHGHDMELPDGTYYSYQGLCDRHELHWSCDKWEEEMGEDL